MKLIKILPFLFALLLLGGCSKSDDVLDIFTQGTWKLTNIFDKPGNPHDYWPSEEAHKASMALLEQPANFTITFTGAPMEDAIEGTYNGRSAKTGISGKWTANGKNNHFETIGQADPSPNEDVFGKAYINGLRNAYKYEGDTSGNLIIYFKDGDFVRFMMFHPTK